MRGLRILVWTMLAPVLLVAIVWACAVLSIDGGVPSLGVAGFAFLSAGFLTLLRPRPIGLAAFAVLFAAVLLWWFSIAPSNDRTWQPDLARTPTAVFDGDLVTVHNVRNFHYRTETDYDEGWEDRTYDLSKLTGLDFYLSYWGSPWIAHTIASWTFEDSPPIAISIETRKEVGEDYSATLGFFRQFELYYVVADERDLIRLRTNIREEDVYLYRLAAPIPRARALLVDYLERVNDLAETPRWYNAATQNCTTTIRQHTQHVAGGRPWDWRILVNGRLDELGYERGSINQSLPFEEMRRRSAISEVGRAAGDSADFSARIRENLPARPSPSPL